MNATDDFMLDSTRICQEMFSSASLIVLDGRHCIIWNGILLADSWEGSRSLGCMSNFSARVAVLFVSTYSIKPWLGAIRNLQSQSLIPKDTHYNVGSELSQGLAGEKIPSPVSVRCQALTYTHRDSRCCNVLEYGA